MFSFMDFRRLPLQIVTSFLVCMALLVSTENVQASPGSCAEFDFSNFYHNNSLKWAGVARVLRHHTPLHADAETRKIAAQLPFNLQAEILSEKGKRVQLRTLPGRGGKSQTGWADKENLLCRNLPIKSDTGLEIKFFIKTDITARQQDQSEPMVSVYRDPELVGCVDGKACIEGAARFQMYFVFDEREQSVLLADRYRLEEGDMLLGWVKKSNGFRWNNAFGLRPAEHIKSPYGDDAGTICAYSRLKDAVSQNPEACNPVKGGNAWFKSPSRIPVLDLVDKNDKHVRPEDLADKNSDQRLFYKVALAQPGLVGRALGNGKFAISSDLARQIIPEQLDSLESLSAKKKVDVFFLLDATASMDAVIDAVRGNIEKRGVIQEIIATLKSTPGFDETEFRFGFRVYRDPYADKVVTSGPGLGVGEGFPLPDMCEMNAASRTAAYEDFEREIAQVQSTADDQDDYEENMYGGLVQTLQKDIVSCPENLKLLFVIGDHGFKRRQTVILEDGRARSIDKYGNPTTRGDLARLLLGGDTPGVKGNNVISFFIQTPNRKDQAKHPTAYMRAYRKFETQARSLLSDSLPSDSNVDDHFFRMGEEKLVARLVQTVGKFASSTLINEIILDVRGGKALSQVIDRLRRERVDIPGVFWHVLEHDACGKDVKNCRDQVFDTTQVGYIEANDDIVEELWISSSALSSWIRILRGFEGYYELPEQQLRRALISALVLGLQQEIRKPPIDVSGETPAEYAQRRGGLPVRRHSPLLSYKVAAISANRVARDDSNHLIVVNNKQQPILDKAGMTIQAVPNCELRRLALWAIRSKEMLEVVERNFTRPVFKVGFYSPARCPDATSNGRALPRILSTIEAEPLGPNKEYRLSHSFGGRRGYWIPKEYLP
ncbi:MAG: hypothetical protein HQL54_09720 [Magnetococcales bacterium]|nr:hypothetical protein [Magnetococcales bacterium]